jgi:hypothetical protein
VAKVREDSLALAFVRRFLSNLVPQKYRVERQGGGKEAELRVRFNPFIYKLDVRIETGATLDRRLILGAAVLVSAIEGRQT